jgi:NADPH:quinone reductase-like Zn-dependent oxidoreductase
MAPAVSAPPAGPAMQRKALPGRGFCACQEAAGHGAGLQIDFPLLCTRDEAISIIAPSSAGLSVSNVTVPSLNTRRHRRARATVSCNWSDAELASIPCAFSTAEGMLDRVSVGVERVLVTGASGGVGSAVVQLCKRRRAQVAAVCSPAKAPAVRALGADQTVDRDADVVSELGEVCIDVVIDLVAGRQWPRLLKVLRRGGRYNSLAGSRRPACRAADCLRRL